MVFNNVLQRGVKKKALESPRVIDFPNTATYCEIIEKSKHIFFPQESDDVTCYCLCGSSGFPFQIDDKDNWVLQEFIKQHNFQPSKLRLYIMHLSEVSVVLLNFTCLTCIDTCAQREMRSLALCLMVRKIAHCSIHVLAF